MKEKEMQPDLNLIKIKVRADKNKKRVQELK
jgi:hypothetical protein